MYRRHERKSITVKAEIYTGLDNPFSENDSVPPPEEACCVGQQDPADHRGAMLPAGLKTASPERKLVFGYIHVENARGNAKVVTAYKGSYDPFHMRERLFQSCKTVSRPDKGVHKA